MIDRRKFLELPLLGVPFLLSQNVIAKQHIEQNESETRSSLKVKMPVVVSTWDSGITANKAAWPILSAKGNILDAVESAGRAAELEKSCCVGLGANPDRDGNVTLDACIMNGNGDCGGVSFLERIKHPISVARKVMETTPHVLLSGEGAQAFALANGFTLESGKLSTEAELAWKKWLKNSKYQPAVNIENVKETSQNHFPPFLLSDGTLNHDTIGTIALGSNGKLAGMVTTSGLAFKMRGRVGDSPIIGAGLFVDNEVGAATSSGVGEEVIRICGTHTIIEQMRFGRQPEQACREAVRRIVKRDPVKAKNGIQVGFIALSKDGEIGAFSIQKGFTFSVTNSDYPNGKVFESKSWV